MSNQHKDTTQQRLSRRGVVAGGLAAGSVAATGAVVWQHRQETKGIEQEPLESIGTEQETFYGEHQAGLLGDPQAYGNFISFDLKANVKEISKVRSMMKILTDDAARLMKGENALADMEPELARIPASLTLTFGFGPSFFEKLNIENRKPAWLKVLPIFKQDQLDQAQSNGDFMVSICANDAVTVAHATRIISKDARSFCTVRWEQQGFRNAAGTVPKGQTTRNLFGQLDGSRNPTEKDENFNEVMWSQGSGDKAWITGGTSFVYRKIKMDLEGWDQIDRGAREIVIGRNLDNGAPLTGTKESDVPDLDKRDSNGLLIIPEYAHIRRAQTDDSTQRMVRRPYNYDSLQEGSGLIFNAYQADPDHQFIPIQRRLDELDLLNKWVTPVASAIFAIPPGCQEGGYIGEGILGS
ncbi:MAG: Dyp-type peroxidase [Micrococcaceae bacterium]